jgi:hypothetical protein
MRIGSVMYHRFTGEVVVVVEDDTLYGEYNLQPETMSRWLSIDPLAADFPEWSPYSFTFNNPIIFIDPDGRAPDNVIINGPDADRAVAELNAATGLDIVRNAETGMLQARGEANTPAERQLLTAINDPDNHVVLDATNATTYNDPKDGTPNIPLLPGGYIGSDVEMRDGVEHVTGQQKVNMDVATVISGVIGEMPGETVMHEINESYIGTQIDPGGTYGTGYERSHGRAAGLDAHPSNIEFNNVQRVVDGRRATVMQVRRVGERDWTDASTIFR